MRVIGGRLSGRRFQAPPGKLTRPTPERVREALASALEARQLLAGARVLDLFAGSGALSFEALSRGAERALLVENDRRASRAISEATDALGLSSLVEIAWLDLIASPAVAAARVARSDAGPFTLVFADPPYREIDSLPPLLRELVAHKCLSGQAVIAVEHASSRPPAEHAGFDPLAAYRYGDSSVLLLHRAEL